MKAAHDDGLHPHEPAARALGIKLEESQPGSAIMSMRVTEHMVNAGGVCHGGLIFTLADTALAYAGGGGGQVMTSSLTIDYLKPAVPGDRLIAVAKERHRSRRAGMFDIEVTREDGGLIAVVRGRGIIVETERKDGNQKGERR